MVKILGPVNVAKCKVVHIGSVPYVGNYCLNETLCFGPFLSVKILMLLLDYIYNSCMPHH